MKGKKAVVITLMYIFPIIMRKEWFCWRI